ncbi:MAG: Stp1/IreP family PP2C-type Ser/Thr phosphatase [Clostridia bacterium]|nr:Stp1/IreP family PP2C-type Ser/Thr phosphatase [Clostridia bacterium]
MICSGNTDIGMKRESNQDTFVLKTYSEKTCLCVVCDGMGGAKGGKEASKIAAEKFVSVIDDFISPYIGRKDRNLHSNDIKDALIDAVDQANNAVYQYALDHSSMKGMGTTLVAALIINRTVFSVNVGDSRMYFMKGSKIKQVTKDHSYLQYLLDMGQISEKDASSFPNKNVITRAVGTESSVRADFVKENVSEGAYVMLCTDGLTNLVDNETIRGTVIDDQSKNLDQIKLSLKIRKLIDTANKNGGTDNITAVIVKL